MPAAIYKTLNLTKDEFKDKLENLYWSNNLSQSMIAEKLNCDITCIENWFQTLQIPRRKNTVQYKDINISNKQHQVLDGLLLSDLHIEQGWKNCRLTCGFKYKEMLQSVISSLDCFTWSTPRQDKNTKCWHSKSCTHPLITELRTKWYPDGIKIVPKDLTLSSLCCYWWYLGDGYLRDYNLRLCTQGFTDTDILRLINLLSVIGIKSQFTKSSRVITILSQSCSKFLQYIGNCQMACYKYKWIYPKDRK